MAFNWNAQKFALKSALSRLCFVMAVTTLLLTVQGQQVVTSGKRRWVDVHEVRGSSAFSRQSLSDWQRGNSYLRIGWNWLKGVLHQDGRLFRTISLHGQSDPDPAFASKKQIQKQFEREFTIKSYSFVS